MSFEHIGPTRAATVLVLGGISANRHVASSDEDRRQGWWEPVVGEGRAVDTRHVRVLGVDYLDGGCDSGGKPERIITTRDQADAIAALLDTLAIDRLHAVIGASYGGMVALAFAERHPGRLDRLVVIGAAHESQPMTTALRAVQRRIVELGLECGRPGEALATARALAMTTYRSAAEFRARFAVVPDVRPDGRIAFPVESYLWHHGARFAATWPAARFLALSLSADLHRVDPARIETPTLLVAADHDAIAPREQLDELAAAIAAPVRIARIETDTGHDAFLTEPRQVGALLHAAIHAPSFP